MVGNPASRLSSLDSSSLSSATATAESTSSPVPVDVLVVGGGVVGTALCDAIERHFPRWTVGLVDTQPQHQLSSPTGIPHPRSYALSPASLELLQIHSTTQRIGWYHRMQVWEMQQPAFVSFGSDDYPSTNEQKQQKQQQLQPTAGEAPPSNVDDRNETHDVAATTTTTNTSQTNTSAASTTSTTAAIPSCLGACVEDRVILHELRRRLQRTRIFSGMQVQDWESSSSAWSLSSTSPSRSLSVTLLPTSLHRTGNAPSGPEPSTGPRTVQTRLLVAADGAQSFIRQRAGIPWIGYDYGQTAFTVTVRLKNPLRLGNGAVGGGTAASPTTAFQRFLPTGPMALLPTHCDQHAVIVWTTTPTEASYWNRVVGSQSHNHPAQQNLVSGHDAIPMNAEEHRAQLVTHLNRLLQHGPDRLESLFSACNAVQFPSTILSTTPWLGNVLYGMEKVMETIQYAPAMSAVAFGNAYSSANKAATGGPALLDPWIMLNTPRSTHSVCDTTHH